MFSLILAITLTKSLFGLIAGVLTTQNTEIEEREEKAESKNSMWYTSAGRFGSHTFWKKGKDPHPQDKIQHLDFTKDPRPRYYKTPPSVFYHKNVRSKAVFGP